jgi:hypothetical protein
LKILKRKLVNGGCTYAQILGAFCDLCLTHQHKNN